MNPHTIARFLSFVMTFAITWYAAWRGLQDIGVNSHWLSGLAAWFMSFITTNLSAIREVLKTCPPAP